MRCAALAALALVAANAQAQHVRYDQNGQADVVATHFMVVNDALVRQGTGRPAGDMGQVVFFRPARAATGDVMVSEGGREVYGLPDGGWFVALVRPGEHTFAVDGQQIPLLVQPGRSYFVRVAGAAGAPRLSRSTPIAFLSATGSRPMPQM